jgi:hypothetical protein
MPEPSSDQNRPDRGDQGRSALDALVVPAVPLDATCRYREKEGTMPRGNASSLSEQRRKLEAKLRAIKQQEETEANRRLIAAGRAVLAHADQDAAFRDQLHGILTTQVKKKRERALFDLDGGDPPAAGTAPSSSS